MSNALWDQEGSAKANLEFTRNFLSLFVLGLAKGWPLEITVAALVAAPFVQLGWSQQR